MFFRNNAYANADLFFSVGTSGALQAITGVEAKGTASTDIQHELGTQGDTIDSERIDGHKATAEKWIDDAQTYAHQTIQSYTDGGMPLDGESAHAMESRLTQQYLADRLDAVAETERDRMMEIANGDHRPLVSGSDSLERNTENKEDEPTKYRNIREMRGR